MTRLLKNGALIFVILGCLHPLNARAQFIEEFPDLDFEGGMDRILTKYFALYDQLLLPNPSDIRNLSRELGVTVKQLNVVNVAFKHEPHFKHLKSEMLATAKEMMKPQPIKERRQLFKTLSKHMANWATITEPAGIIVVYCPIANARWIQHTGEIQNPYFGVMRLSCGQIVGGGKEAPKEPASKTPAKLEPPPDL